MLRVVILAIFGAVDFVFYHAARPIGFIARSIRDGLHAGFYSVEYKLMEALQDEEPNLDGDTNE